MLCFTAFLGVTITAHQYKTASIWYGFLFKYVPAPRALQLYAPRHRVPFTEFKCTQDVAALKISKSHKLYHSYFWVSEFPTSRCPQSFLALLQPFAPRRGGEASTSQTEAVHGLWTGGPPRLWKLQVCRNPARMTNKMSSSKVILRLTFIKIHIYNKGKKTEDIHKFGLARRRQEDNGVPGRSN